MQKTTRLLTGLIGAALLAACSSNGSSIPSSQSPISPMAAKAPSTAAYALRDARGVPIAGTHIMPTRDLIGNFKPLRQSRTSNLNYYGGPVQTTPSIYVVYWGYTSSNDIDGMQTRMTNFYNAVGGSSWNNTVTQYYQSGPTHISNSSGQLKGAWVDTTNAVPSSPTDAQVAAESVKLAQHFGVYSENVSYVVATPHGHNTSGFATQWCAYHSTTSANGAVIPYTNLPYMPDGGASCGADSVNGGSAGTLDGATIVGGHELAETQTDPGAGNGWLDSRGNEIGDKCAWISLQNTSFGSASYPTQPLWSNAAKGCVQ